MPTYQCRSIARAMICPSTGTDQNSITVAISPADASPTNGANRAYSKTNTSVMSAPTPIIADTVCNTRAGRPLAIARFENQVASPARVFQLDD